MNNVPGVSHSQEEEETILLLFKHTLDDRVNLLPETELEVTEFSKKKKNLPLNLPLNSVR